MPEALVAVGIGAQVALWRSVALGRLPFWPTISVAFGALGSAALLVGSVSWRDEVGAPASLAVGVGSGLLLYVATRVVVEGATRLPSLEASVIGVYGLSAGVSPVAMWALTLVLVVPGEELFWRGLVLPELQRSTSIVAGAVLTWVGAVGVTALWSSAPLLAAAVVGGAVWTALGAWSGGVLAPIASHLVWTSLMLAWPPSAGRAKVRP
jgi:membrane protease YdiL (CAAX protease family)